MNCMEKPNYQKTWEEAMNETDKTPPAGRKLKDFKCMRCGNVHEAYTNLDNDRCPKCLYRSNEIKAFPKARPQFKGDFPGESLRKKEGAGHD